MGNWLPKSSSALQETVAQRVQKQREAYSNRTCPQAWQAYDQCADRIVNEMLAGKTQATCYLDPEHTRHSVWLAQKLEAEGFNCKAVSGIGTFDDPDDPEPFATVTRPYTQLQASWAKQKVAPLYQPEKTQ